MTIALSELNYTESERGNQNENGFPCRYKPYSMWGVEFTRAEIKKLQLIQSKTDEVRKYVSK